MDNEYDQNVREFQQVISDENSSGGVQNPNAFGLEELLEEQGINNHQVTEQKVNNPIDVTSSEESPRPQRVERKRQTQKNHRETIAERRYKARLQQQEAQMAQILEENEALRNATFSQADESIINERDAARSKMRELTRALALAKEEGRPDVEAEAQVMMAKLAAQEIALENKKQMIEEYKNQPNNNSSYYGPDYYAEPQQEADPNFLQWAEQNPWINPESRVYDSELAEEAHMVARALDKEAKLSNNYDYIGSREYYNQITQRLNDAWGVRSKSNHAPVPRDTRRGFVSPASHGPSYNVYSDGRSSQGRDMVLTPEEIDVAKKTIGYENPNMTDQQRITRYKQLKLKLIARDNDIRNRGDFVDPKRFELI